MAKATGQSNPRSGKPDTKSASGIDDVFKDVELRSQPSRYRGSTSIFDIYYKDKWIGWSHSILGCEKEVMHYLAARNL